MLNEQELDTVLAALRFWQRVALAQDCSGPEDEIATRGGEHALMQPDEIDDLCERLNFPDPLRVTVQVSGGVVQHVEVPAGVNVRVLDYDGEGSDFADKDANGDGCNISEWVGTQ